MPRKRKPARLWYRKDRDEYYILDNGKQFRTGCNGSSAEEAEIALSLHLAKKAGEKAASLPFPTVGEVLAHYYLNCTGRVHDLERIYHALRALQPLFAEVSPSAVTPALCKEYVTKRPGLSPATVRRELSCLNSALELAEDEKRLEHPFKVWLPRKPGPRNRWLDRSELRRLIRASPPHLRRFIIISIYTGRRHKAVTELRWRQSTEGGWIDLHGERIDFLPLGRSETKKRRGSAPTPTPLQRLLRRWHRQDMELGLETVISYRGQPVKSIKRAFSAACEKAGLDGVVPHVLKHTAVTRYFRLEGDLAGGVDFFATTAETLMEVYRKHHPDFARAAADTLSKPTP